MNLSRGETMPEASVGPFDSHALAAYAEASGDDNPLHLDDDVARRAGFAAPPAHGMLLMAMIEPALKRWRPNIRLLSLDAQFAAPLLRGEAAIISARVVKAEALQVLLRIVIRGPRRAPCLIGEAWAVLAEEAEGGAVA